MEYLILMHAQTEAEAITETIVMGIVFLVLVVGFFYVTLKLME